MPRIRGVAKKFQGRLLRREDANLSKATKTFLLRKSDKCGICGEQIKSMKDVTIDHIMPLSRGGINGIQNMQLAHYECNQLKGNKLPEELERDKIMESMTQTANKPKPSSRFDYVKYDEHAVEIQESFKSNVSELEARIELYITCPRSKALALTNLEQVYMWIGKGIRNDQIKRNGSAPLQEERTNS